MSFDEKPEKALLSWNMTLPPRFDPPPV
jgi:hypothetical protein